MAWRSIHISNPCDLKLRHSNLVVEYWASQESATESKESVCLPIEDLASIVFDTRQYRISGPLLSACMERGIALVISDDRHMPSGVALPFHQHYKQADVAWMQVAVSAAVSNRLWRRIVQAKIANQAAILDRTGKGAKAKPLWAMSKRKTKVDPSQLEAQAARVYWQALFDGFTRSDKRDKRNAMLNYGYAIVRASLSRAAVGVGLLPAFGLHHRSQSNNFNLADDIIEPFRPLVDSMVWSRLQGLDAAESQDLTLADRQHMTKVLGQQVRIEGQATPLLAAMERVLETLVTAMRTGKADLLRLPEVR